MEHAIRVYAFIRRNDGSILLSEEAYKGFEFVKLPGGGLHFGESTSECLKRELSEELGIQHYEMRQICFNDSLILNRFNPEQQVHGLYYELADVDQNLIEKAVTKRPFVESSGIELTKLFWTVPEKCAELLTLEMDKKALQHYLRMV